MRVKYLQCVRCGRQYPRGEVRYRCECGDSLEIVYDYAGLKGKLSWEQLRSRAFCHWRYQELYPPLKASSVVSMAEGGTPLIRSRNLEREPGRGGSLSFKMESVNPTGSFKDRGSTIEVSQAYEYICDSSGKCGNEIVCASTGNMGASVAAYCARAGLCCTIYVPRDTPKVKLLQMIGHGARIVRVKGDYTLAMLTAKKEYEDHGKYLAGDYPYRSEGEKSVGLEIADVTDGNVDYIACPIGNGTLLHGVWKGLKELKALGLINRLPKIVGAQAEGCNTVVRSFQEGTEQITPVQPRTLMDAVACGDPLDGLWALRALKESEGWGVAVSDAEAARARNALAKREGIFAELSGALSYAGLLKAYDEGIVERDASVVSIVTGHGLKEPETFEDEMRKISHMDTR
jgi:threonine synthase